MPAACDDDIAASINTIVASDRRTEACIAALGGESSLPASAASCIKLRLHELASWPSRTTVWESAFARPYRTKARILSAAIQSRERQCRKQAFTLSASLHASISSAMDRLDNTVDAAARFALSVVAIVSLTTGFWPYSWTSARNVSPPPIAADTTTARRHAISRSESCNDAKGDSASLIISKAGYCRGELKDSEGAWFAASYAPTAPAASMSSAALGSVDSKLFLSRWLG